MSKNKLEKIYSENVIKFQQKRYSELTNGFERVFGSKAQRYFSAPGRTEICGNHTDHQNGKVLAAGVSLDVIAAVVPTDDGIIQVKSKGYPIDIIDISELEKRTHQSHL